MQTIEPRPGFFITKQFLLSATDLPAFARRRATIDIQALRVVEAPDLATPFAHLESFDYVPVDGLLVRVVAARARLESEPREDVLAFVDIEVENTTDALLSFETTVTLTGVAARETAAGTTRAAYTPLTNLPLELAAASVGGAALPVAVSVLSTAGGSGGAGGDADTLNSFDGAYYLSRLNHTDTQPMSTIDGLGSALGAKADLVDGRVPVSQLPSYVDTIIEAANLAAFPAPGTSGVIYVALDTNLVYRWSGTQYTEVSASLALGETAATAYRGDRGKAAYDHSQITGANPHGVDDSTLNAQDPTNSNTLAALRTVLVNFYNQLTGKADKLIGTTTATPRKSESGVADFNDDASSVGGDGWREGVVSNFEGRGTKWFGADRLDGVSGNGGLFARFVQSGGVQNAWYLLKDWLELRKPIAFWKVSALATPPSGQTMLGIKSDGKAYLKQSDGTETALGSGSGTLQDDTTLQALDPTDSSTAQDKIVNITATAVAAGVVLLLGATNLGSGGNVTINPGDTPTTIQTNLRALAGYNDSGVVASGSGFSAITGSDGLTVADSGTWGAGGDYAQDGTQNSKSKFTDSTDATLHCQYDTSSGGRWTITDDDRLGDFLQVVSTADLPPATGWTDNFGTPYPDLTVTVHTASGTSTGSVGIELGGALGNRPQPTPTIPSPVVGWAISVTQEGSAGNVKPLRDVTANLYTAIEAGAGAGDMTKAVYDTNNDGVVDSAATAASVAWSGVTGTPTTIAGYGITDTLGNMTKAVYDTNNSGVVDSAEAVAWTGVTGKPTFGGAATLNVGTTTGTVAAGDDARFSILQPVYRSADYVPFFDASTADSSLSGVNQVLYLFPVWVTQSTSYTELEIELTGGSSAAGDSSARLLRFAHTSGWLGNQVVDYGVSAQALTANGFKTFAAVETLTAGVYWFGLHVLAATTGPVFKGRTGNNGRLGFNSLSDALDSASCGFRRTALASPPGNGNAVSGTINPYTIIPKLTFKAA